MYITGLQINETIFFMLYEIYRWFSPGTPVSSTNKTDRHDIAEILLLNTISLTKPYMWLCFLFLNEVFTIIYRQNWQRKRLLII
jgi:hypothetical protein